MGNLIVSDDEYTELAKAIRLAGTIFERKLEVYLDILAEVSSTGISKGQVKENLMSFASTARILTGQFGSVAEECASLSESFITEVDEADGPIYGG